MHDGSLHNMEVDLEADTGMELNRIKKLKAALKTKDLCFGTSECLSDFKKEVFSYRFKDEPRYNHLREILTKQIYPQK